MQISISYWLLKFTIYSQGNEGNGVKLCQAQIQGYGSPELKHCIIL